MYISQIEVQNYKSFYESRPLVLQPGFNIITGQNSAGKTALLNAMGLNFQGSAHRSQRTVPTPGAVVDSTSSVDVSITAVPTEVLAVLQRPIQYNWLIAQPNWQGPFAIAIGARNGSSEDVQRLLHHVFSQDSLTFRFRYQASLGQGGGWAVVQIPTFGLYTAQGHQNNRGFTTFQVKPDLSFSASGGGVVSVDTAEFGLEIARYFQSRVYRFSAERFNIGACAHGNNPALRPDAGNLPEVLGILQANTHRFAHFNALLKSVLPQVHHVSVRPSPQAASSVEIIVWTTPKESERIDLALPLSECGTGVGQVMAILYVMLHPETAQTLIIDEPQSFLHPGAARKLIEVLKVNSKQQIIMATHSATIISAAEPETITIVTLKDGRTELDQLDVRNSKALETCLAEIGARLSDVFGADNVLWVEGATEAICYPIILSRIAKRTLMGTAIIGVRQVGDLEGRDARRVLEIYNSLSATASLIPPAIGFLLDGECRSPEEKLRLNRLGKNLVSFLPRRMFENYLLHPAAIASVANAIPGFSGTPVTEAAVRALIDEKRLIGDYFCDQMVPGAADEWIREIDAARVLKEIFAELSQTRVSYDKVKHSVALTEWIVNQDPQELDGIATLLTQILG